VSRTFRDGMFSDGSFSDGTFSEVTFCMCIVLSSRLADEAASRYECSSVWIRIHS
jgi:hypothetical protein